MAQPMSAVTRSPAQGHEADDRIPPEAQRASPGSANASSSRRRSALSRLEINRPNCPIPQLPDYPIQPNYPIQKPHRTSTAPTVKPAPTDASSTRSPFLSRPDDTASFSASGIVAAVVLPNRSMLMMTLSGGTSSFSVGGLDDPAVRLVRDEQVEVGRAEPVPLEHPPRDLLGLPDRELEHRLRRPA